MKRLLSAILLLFSVSMTWAQSPTSDDIERTLDAAEALYHKAPDGYYFEKQIIDIKVHHDRTMDISEELWTKFLEPSHGIFRTIPKRFWVKRDVSELQDGSKYEMRYNPMTIEDLTVSEEFMTEDLDSLLDVRIGSADVMVNGPHTYKLSYKLTIPNDDRVDASDLFFHSVIGSGWLCGTDIVSFHIHFDDAMPEESVAATKVFVGTEGDETDRSDFVLLSNDGNDVAGQYNQLKCLEALTVYIPLPDGYFEKGEIPVWSKIAWVMALITLLLALYLLFYEVKGDERVTPVVAFQPPKGLTSADVGSLIDASVDDIDLLSVIPWLAAEGYIRMTQDEKGKTLIELARPLDESVPPYIKNIYDGFFATSEKFYIDNPTREFGKQWNRAKSMIEHKYADKLSDKTNLLPLFLTCLSFSITCGCACVPPHGGVLTFAILILLVSEYFFFGFWRKKYKKINFRKGFTSGISTLGIVIVLAFLIPLGAATYFTMITSEGDYYLPQSILLALGALVAVLVMFNYRLNRLSELRRKYIGEVLGLKEFILTAEKSRLEMLLSKDERYFYRVLPYAMVFGLVDKWAEKFNGLIVDPVPEFSNLDVSRIPSMLNSHSMNRFAQKSSLAATPPSSSSSYSSSRRSYSSSGGSYRSASRHSGGYSGGGSGGGGGRRW